MYLTPGSGGLQVGFRVFGWFRIRFFEHGIDAAASTPLVDVHRRLITIWFGKFDIGGLVGTTIIRELDRRTIAPHAAPLASFAETVTVSATD
jgi:hypothetical protein